MNEQKKIEIKEQKAKNIVNVETQKIIQNIKANPLDAFLKVLWPALGFLIVFLMNTQLEDSISYHWAFLATVLYFLVIAFKPEFFKRISKNFLLFFIIFSLSMGANFMNANYFKTSVLESAEEGKLNFAFLRMIYKNDPSAQDEATEQWQSILEYFKNQFLVEKAKSKKEISDLKILKDFSFSETMDLEKEIEKDYMESLISEEGVNLDVVFFGNSNPNPTKKQDITFSLNFLVTNSSSSEISLPEGIEMNALIGNMKAKATMSGKETFSDLFLGLAFLIEEDYELSEEFFENLVSDDSELDSDTKADLSVYLAITKVLQEDYEGAKKVIADGNVSYLLPEGRLLASSKFMRSRYKNRSEKTVSRIYNLLGVIEMGLGNYEKAEDYFIDSKEHDEDFIISDNNFAINNIAIGVEKLKKDPQEARKRFEVAERTFKIFESEFEANEKKLGIEREGSLSSETEGGIFHKNASEVQKRELKIDQKSLNENIALAKILVGNDREEGEALEEIKSQIQESDELEKISQNIQKAKTLRGEVLERQKDYFENLEKTPDYEDIRQEFQIELKKMNEEKEEGNTRLKNKVLFNENDFEDGIEFHLEEFYGKDVENFKGILSQRIQEPKEFLEDLEPENKNLKPENDEETMKQEENLPEEKIEPENKIPEENFSSEKDFEENNDNIPENYIPLRPRETIISEPIKPEEVLPEKDYISPPKEEISPEPEIFPGGREEIIDTLSDNPMPEPPKYNLEDSATDNFDTTIPEKDYEFDPYTN